MIKEDLLNDLRHNMKHSIVSFSYRKKDGSLRNAKGTLSESIITDRGGEIPKGTGETPSDTFPYWDIEAEGWRCFKEAYLIDANIDEVRVLPIFQENF